MARQTCLDCVRKHLGQAAVLLDEAAMGYPHHKWFAVGHLAEAESESRREHPELAARIRQERITFMNTGVEPNFDSLILEASATANETSDWAVDPNNSKKFDAIELGVMNGALTPAVLASALRDK